MKRPSYSYKQALALLVQGEIIQWNSYPASKATINGITVNYPAWLKLHNLLEPVSKGFENNQYKLKEGPLC